MRRISETASNVQRATKPVASWKEKWLGQAVSEVGGGGGLVRKVDSLERKRPQSIDGGIRGICSKRRRGLVNDQRRAES